MDQRRRRTRCSEHPDELGQALSELIQFAAIPQPHIRHEVARRRFVPEGHATVGELCRTVEYVGPPRHLISVAQINDGPQARLNKPFLAWQPELVEAGRTIERAPSGAAPIHRWIAADVAQIVDPVQLDVSLGLAGLHAELRVALRRTRRGPSRLAELGASARARGVRSRARSG